MRHLSSFIEMKTFEYLPQDGLGDGKLTALKLRTGFERLVTHIARRECSCRAYKCDKIATYGLRADTQDSIAKAGAMSGGVVDGDSVFNFSKQRSFDAQERDTSQATPDHYCSSEHDVGEAQRSGTAEASVGATATASGCAPIVAGTGDPDDDLNQRSDGARGEEEWTAEREVHSTNREFVRAQKPEQQRSHHREGGDDAARLNSDSGGGGHVTSPGKIQRGLLGSVDGSGSGGSGNAAAVSVEKRYENGGVGKEQELRFEQGEEDTDREEAIKMENRSSVDLSNAGGAVACRKHTLEGMVYLGQR